MKRSQILHKIIAGIALVILLTGCSGTYFSESLGSILNCIFYGECDYYFDYNNSTEFRAFDNNDGTVLAGKWLYRPQDSENYYELTFFQDRRLEIVLYKKGAQQPVRTDRGIYLPTDEKLTISMENGTRSVVNYYLDNRILYLSPPLAE